MERAVRCRVAVRLREMHYLSCMIWWVAVVVVVVAVEDEYFPASWGQGGASNKFRGHGLGNGLDLELRIK